MDPRRELAALGLLALLVAPGCGSDGNEGAPSSLPETDRPQIAFWRASGEAVYDIGIADDRGNDVKILAGESVPGTTTPQLFSALSWSPDGERLAVAGGEGEQVGRPGDQMDIYLIDVEASGVERLTDTGDAVYPVWSPDGETIVFTRYRYGARDPLRADLWSIEAGGGEPKQITTAPSGQVDVAGSFTPDGSRLAFTRNVIDAGGIELQVTSSIHTIDPDGSNENELVERGSHPAFSPDGDRLAFVSDRDENGELCYGDRCFFGGELYVAAADGSDPERLTETAELNEARPSWLLDGSRIAYQRGKVFQNAEAMSVLEINADGTCEREILAGSGPGTWYASAAWRPSTPREGGGPLSC